MIHIHNIHTHQPTSCHERPRAYNLRRERELAKEREFQSWREKRRKRRKRGGEERKQNPSRSQSLSSSTRSFLFHPQLSVQSLVLHDMPMRCVTPLLLSSYLHLAQPPGAFKSHNNIHSTNIYLVK